MPRQTQMDFLKLKGFLEWSCEVDPVYKDVDRKHWADKMVEEVDAKFGRAIAFKSLNLGIRDVVQKFDPIQGEVLLDCDRLLDSRGFATLSEVRIWFSTDLKKIEKRMSIKTEDEFYLVRNAIEMPFIKSDQPRLEKLMMMLSDFEFGQSASSEDKS